MQPEVWLRGPVDGVSPLLQPAAHALLQTIEDVEAVAAGLTVEQLWTAPGGAASIGFHLFHLAGSTDRLMTAARGEELTEEQRGQLKAEKSPERSEVGVLLAQLRRTIERAVADLRATPDAVLTQPRTVGRAKLPTTVLGLMFHAAEHAQRHAGQVVTTVKILRGVPTGEQAILR